MAAAQRGGPVWDAGGGHGLFGLKAEPRVRQYLEALVLGW